MVASPVRRACLVLFSTPLVFCSVASAFEQEVAIVPRAKPKAAVDAANNPHADMRVDVPLVLIPVNVTTPLGS